MGIPKHLIEEASTFLSGVGRTVKTGQRGSDAVPIDKFTAGFGPAEAARRYEEGAAARSWIGTPPARAPLEDLSRLPEPHMQTRAEFADDPRSWWHGRFAEDLPTSAAQTKEAGGIHVGSYRASEARRLDMLKLGPPRGGATWQSFPVRLQGQASNDPFRPGKDLGLGWTPSAQTHYYSNAVEDRGSVSALVPGRADMRTHAEYISAALAEGKHVDPKILHEHNMLAGMEFDPRKASMHGPGYPEPLKPFSTGTAGKARIVANIESSEKVRGFRSFHASSTNEDRARLYRQNFPGKRHSTARKGLAVHSSAPAQFTPGSPSHGFVDDFNW